MASEPSPATFRRILSPESIQATAPPDRVTREREHFCLKLLADSGGGMILLMGRDRGEPATPDLFSTQRSETVLHRE